MKNEASSARRIRDDRGYSFSVSARPSRIVSLTYGTDEILLGLVDTDRVEALSGYAGNADITFVTPAERDAWEEQWISTWRRSLP